MRNKSTPILVVMAAGMGSRYHGFKQLEAIGPNGEIIVEYSIYDAIKAGFEKVVFVINKYVEEALRLQIDQTIGKQCQLIYVHQELSNIPQGLRILPRRQKPWGTAHAVMCCKDVISGPFVVINSDDFYGRSSFYDIFAYRYGGQDNNSNEKYCMVGYILDNTLTEYGYVSRGICEINEYGYLVSIHERTRIKRFGKAIKYVDDDDTQVDLVNNRVVSMNMWGFTPKLFVDLHESFTNFLSENSIDILEAEFLLPEAINQLINENKAIVKVLPTKERWYGITYKQDKDQVKKAICNLINKGIYPENLWGLKA